MLKMAKIELELILDPDIYIFFKKGTRGGISYSSNRYSKANDKYLKSYGAKQKPNQIIYLDANDLYGYVTWIKILAIVQEDVFSKLILNTQKN